MCPSASASAAPPMPVVSPAAHTPGTSVRCSSSTATFRPSIPAAERLGEVDVRQHAVTDGDRVTRDAPPGAGADPSGWVSSAATVTASSRPLAVCRDDGVSVEQPDVVPQELGAVPHSFGDLPGLCGQCHGPPQERLRVGGLDEGGDLDPRLASLVATGSSRGPVPATTARCPGTTRPPFSMACAPPAVTTPGRVQPGNGSTFSYPPVARSTASARTVTGPPGGGRAARARRSRPSRAGQGAARCPAAPRDGGLEEFPRFHGFDAPHMMVRQMPDRARLDPRGQRVPEAPPGPPPAVQRLRAPGPDSPGAGGRTGRPLRPPSRSA